jgi:hypothetical protein
VVRGTAELEGTARVFGDVWLMSARLEKSDGASVGGAVRGVLGAPAWRFLVEEPLLAAGLLVLVLTAGWAGVAVSAGTMRRAAGALTGDLSGSLGAALLLFVLAPAAALLLFFTVVGLPLSVVYLVVGLPILALVGFCVSGLRVGRWVVRTDSPRPYGAMLLGSAGLAVVGLIPFAGQIIVLLACALGAGAWVVGAGQAEGEETGEMPAVPGG